MATNLADVMSALDDLILEQFKARSEGGGNEPFLAFEMGTPIPDETFHLPPENPSYSPALALEYMSHHANTVPHVHDRLFERTGKTIDGLYEILLLGAAPVDPASMELLGGIKNSAKIAFENTLGSSVGVEDRFRPTHADPVNWYEAAANDNWTTIKVDRTSAPAPSAAPRPIDPRLVQWRLASQAVRPMLSTPVSIQTLSEVVSLQSAAAKAAAAPAPPARRELFMASGAQALGVRAAFRPAEAARTMETNAAAGAAFRMAAQPAETPHPAPRFAHSFTDRADLEVTTAAFTAPSAQAPVSSDGFSISVDVCVVNLRRPWLSDGLLNSKGWYVPTYSQGAFSGGAGVDDPGIFPVLPIACILVRNLTVKAQWSDQDQGNVENSTHLGSFSLLGRHYDRTSATLTVPGMQSAAWICDPLPLLPPADPPAA